MKNYISLFSTIVVTIVLIVVRLIYTEAKADLPIKVTTWDALGYYLYLPASNIYHDDTEFKWFDSIDIKYQISGGAFYQVQKHKNGNLVYKYLRGVSIMQAPFFYLADAYSKTSKKYPADGFSTPYQYAVAWGAIFYIVLAFFLLRTILLRFYSDKIVAVSILLLILATNAVQYISIDSGQSHAYIFPLYVLILYFTIRWHESFKLAWIFAIGFTIGLAMICRPTEAVMLFIPLLWNVNSKAQWKEKWQFVIQHKSQLVFVILGGLVGIMPQLLYWKRITGSWVYDVGSKWDFLNPHFRVLFGWEKGWFIYTPVTILFVVGLFFIKNKPFQKSVIAFCLLNIYIIIAWHIWRYGGSYSTRALMQSYPIFALPLCGFIEFIFSKKIKWILIPISIYFICVNLFQIGQYNQTILHFDDMNRKYYEAIYLNPSPTALDMSLLDTEDFIADESTFTLLPLYFDTTTTNLYSNALLYSDTIHLFGEAEINFLKVNVKLNSFEKFWGNFLVSSIRNGDSIVQHKFRLANALTKINSVNEYSFYIKLPINKIEIPFQLQLEAENYFGEMHLLSVEYFYR